jgi:hypothetical protein
VGKLIAVVAVPVFVAELLRAADSSEGIVATQSATSYRTSEQRVIPLR